MSALFHKIPGNMMIMLYALSQKQQDAEFAWNHFVTLQGWADYLVENGLSSSHVAVSLCLLQRSFLFFLLIFAFHFAQVFSLSRLSLFIFSLSLFLFLFPSLFLYLLGFSYVIHMMTSYNRSLSCCPAFFRWFQRRSCKQKQSRTQSHHWSRGLCKALQHVKCVLFLFLFFSSTLVSRLLVCSFLLSVLHFSSHFHLMSVFWQCCSERVSSARHFLFILPFPLRRNLLLIWFSHTTYIDSPTLAEKYHAHALEMAKEWQRVAWDGSEYLLAYDIPNSWGQLCMFLWAFTDFDPIPLASASSFLGSRGSLSSTYVISMLF